MCFGFHGENFSMKWIELRSMCYKNICARRQPDRRSLEHRKEELS